MTTKPTSDLPGPKTLVLLPGLDGTGRLFRGFTASLPGSLALETTPLPADGAQTYTRLAETLAPKMRALRNLVVLAESFSGPIAARLCDLMPDRIRAVILVASFLTAPHRLLNTIKYLPRSLPFLNRPPAWALRHYCLGRDADDQLVRETKETIASVPSSLLLERLRATLDAEYRFATEIPALYLLPTDDKLVSARHVTTINKTFRHLTVTSVSGPHFILQTKPHACARAIVDFLDTF